MRGKFNPPQIQAIECASSGGIFHARRYGQIQPGPNPVMPPGANWNTTLAYYDGAFDEMFGSFGTMDSDGMLSFSHEIKTICLLCFSFFYFIYTV